MQSPNGTRIVSGTSSRFLTPPDVCYYMIPEEYLPSGWKQHSYNPELYSGDGGNLLITKASHGESCRIILRKSDDRDGISIAKSEYGLAVPVAMWMMEHSEKLFEMYEKSDKVWKMALWDSDEAAKVWEKASKR